MIVVVADTSPLNYLVQIHCQDLLPALYERVLVPPAVIAELDHPATPAAVRTWLAHRPEWIVIGQLQSLSDTPQALPELDPGEREAIQLALEAHADLVLMDEKLGVRLARRRGLKVIGTWACSCKPRTTVWWISTSRSSGCRPQIFAARPSSSNR
jgi:predicted nucleic acid-binding protein